MKGNCGDDANSSKSSKKFPKIHSSSITSVLEDGIVGLMEIIFAVVVSSPSSETRLCM